MKEVLLVITTISNENTAKKIANLLIKKKLAACVSLKNIISIYKWEDDVEETKEVEMTIKSKLELKDDLIIFLKEMTTYEVPQIIFKQKTAYEMLRSLVGSEMCIRDSTYLGASVEFEPKDIDPNIIKRSKYLYLEGYLWDSELAKNAFLKASKIAKSSKTKVILSLSDSFCVDRHRESFLELIENYVDIVFCNESEVLSLFKEDKLTNCMNYLHDLSELSIVTLGSKGSLIVKKKETEIINPDSAGKVIDTTGAGDIYAGGFIHGLIQDYSLKKCGEIGSLCAGQIITQLGSRSNINLQDLINKSL